LNLLHSITIIHWSVVVILRFFIAYYCITWLNTWFLPSCQYTWTSKKGKPVSFRYNKSLAFYVVYYSSKLFTTNFIVILVNVFFRNSRFNNYVDQMWILYMLFYWNCENYLTGWKFLNFCIYLTWLVDRQFQRYLLVIVHELSIHMTWCLFHELIYLFSCIIRACS